VTAETSATAIQFYMTVTSAVLAPCSRPPGPKHLDGVTKGYLRSQLCTVVVVIGNY